MTLDYETLRLIWWVLLGVLLIGFAVMDGFDLGIGTLLPFVAKTNNERRVVINAIGPTWEGNQVWLILGAGAIFAAWPAVYGLAFSGFYFAMLLILLALIIRPLGFKYRSKVDHTAWQKCWDFGLFIGGFVPALLFGVALGNVLQGVPFYFDDTLRAFYTGNLLGLLNPFGILCGLVSVFMLIMHGGTFLCIKTEAAIQMRARRYAQIGAVIYMILFALGGYFIATHINGYVVSSNISPSEPSNPLYKQVATQVGDWMLNYKTYPFFMAAPAAGFIGATLSILLLALRQYKTAWVASGISVAGTVATVGASMFPFIIPSSTNPNMSLLVWDASSSQTTLFIMLIASIIFVPIILLYTSWVYYIMRGKVTEASVQKDSHSY